MSARALGEVLVGDVYEVDGVEWTVHRVSHGRIAAANRVDEHGRKHYQTFALTRLRTARLVRDRVSA